MGRRRAATQTTDVGRQSAVLLVPVVVSDAEREGARHLLHGTDLPGKVSHALALVSRLDFIAHRQCMAAGIDGPRTDCISDETSGSVVDGITGAIIIAHGELIHARAVVGDWS